MNFYELFEMYRDEGYDAEQAEDMAWKDIQGQSEHDTVDVIFKAKIDVSDFQNEDGLIDFPF